MGTPLEIECKGEDDDLFIRFHFKQAGMPGMRLPGCWLREFVECLAITPDSSKICIYQDYHVVNTPRGSTLHKSSIETPLLSIDKEQRAKLIVHLKSTYAALC